MKREILIPTDLPSGPIFEEMMPEVSADAHTTAFFFEPADETSGEPAHHLHRLWEIPPNLRCPVVGTCLGEKEILKILRKAKYKVDKRMDGYILHTRIMERLHDENRVSTLTDNHLRRKYRQIISECARLDEAAFMESWNQRMETGEFDGLFYLSAVKPGLSAEASVKIYGEVHMLGHANIREIMRTRRKMASHRHKTKTRGKTQTRAGQMQICQEGTRDDEIRPERGIRENHTTGSRVRVSKAAKGSRQVGKRKTGVAEEDRRIGE